MASRRRPRRILRLGQVLALGLLLLAGLPDAAPSRAQAGAVIHLRIATLAPSGTPLTRAYAELDRELDRRTNGQVRIQLYAGGSAGDERTVVRKMRVGQLDGAVITTTGLGMLVPAVLVLEAPGVIQSYPQIDAVRRQLGPEFDALFERAGYTLVAWGDAGLIRLFSRQRIERPDDLRHVRPWVWRDSQVMIALMHAAGANGVPLGVPEVYPALQTGMVDTFMASSLTALASQWASRARFVSGQSGGILVGALVLRKDKLDSLPPEARVFILETARSHQSAFRIGARRPDDQAYRAIARRLTVVDTEAHRGEWEVVSARAREALVGRLYPRPLFDRVKRIADAARAWEQARSAGTTPPRTGP